MGINVYCEKPLSLKPVEAKKMIDVCNQNNIILGVGHERRFEKGWLKLKDLVSSEVLGKIMYAEAHFLVMINSQDCQKIIGEQTQK